MKPEAFRPVQRHEAITSFDQAVQLPRVEVAVAHEDVGTVANGRPEPRLLFGEPTSVGRPDDESCPVSRPEGARVRVDQPEWVLAFEHGVEAEVEEEDE